MQNMENVCEIDSQTEQGSKIDNGENVGSADLGKFKDVSALLHAYQALQAEFTRRSQRLKRLEEQEKQRRNAKNEMEPSEGKAENGGAEKLGALDADGKVVSREKSEASSALSGENVGADRGVSAGVASEADAPCVGGESPCSSREENIMANGEGDSIRRVAKSSGVDSDAADAEREIQTDRVEEQSASSLYEMATANEEVRLRIVGDYLSSLGKASAPLIRGGVGSVVATPKKPRNISDAGSMALAYMKARKEQG